MFKCSGCGECCRHIDRAVESVNGDPRFPFLYGWDETGKCEKLGTDNKCMVYDDRPLMCNVDKIAELFALDLNEFYEMNKKACNRLMDEGNIDSSFRL